MTVEMDLSLDEISEKNPGDSNDKSISTVDPRIDPWAFEDQRGQAHRLLRWLQRQPPTGRGVGESEGQDEGLGGFKDKIWLNVGYANQWPLNN